MRLFSLFFFFLFLSLFVSSVGTPAVIWLTGYVKDLSNGEPLEDASVVIEIYSTSKGGGFSANNILSFAKSVISSVLRFDAPKFNRCTGENKVGDLLWSKTFEKVTDAGGRFDVKLSENDDDGDELILEMNTNYYEVLLARNTGDWEQIDLDAGSADTCAAIFRYYGGPGEGEIGTKELGTKAVTKDKIDDNAIQTRNLVNGAVTDDKLDTDSVVKAKIAGGQVSSDKITDDDIANVDVSATAAINPGKIDGTAWTKATDGLDSGLSSDQVDDLNVYWDNPANPRKLCFKIGACVQQSASCNAVANDVPVIKTGTETCSNSACNSGCQAWEVNLALPGQCIGKLGCFIQGQPYGGVSNAKFSSGSCNARNPDGDAGKCLGGVCSCDCTATNAPYKNTGFQAGANQYCATFVKT